MSCFGHETFVETSIGIWLTCYLNCVRLLHSSRLLVPCVTSPPGTRLFRGVSEEERDDRVRLDTLEPE